MDSEIISGEATTALLFRLNQVQAQMLGKTVAKLTDDGAKSWILNGEK